MRSVLMLKLILFIYHISIAIFLISIPFVFLYIYVETSGEVRKFVRKVRMQHDRRHGRLITR